MTQEYLHGYEVQEQERLGSQARFLRPWIYSHIQNLEKKSILEVGCGVGAQLEILQELGAARCVGVDRSSEQLEWARRRLSRLELVQAQGEHLPFADEEFDEVFFFFVLEHVPEAEPLVREAERVVKIGGRITLTEVNNASLQIHPRSPALTQWWAAYNQLQRDLGGNPEVGILLPNLAGALHIERYAEIGPVLDKRSSQEEREQIVGFWLDLFESARERLEREGRVTPQLTAQAYADVRALMERRDGVLFYSGRQIQLRRQV